MSSDKIGPEPTHRKSPHICRGNPSVSVLVINWNGKRFLDGCLGSIQYNSCPNCTEVILVDNGSTDGSVEFTKRKFPHVNVIDNKQNLGFSKGYNVAVPRSRGKHLVFLNNDTQVAPGWLDALIDPFYRQGKIGMTTSKVIFMGTSTINSTGGCVKLWTGGSELGFGRQATDMTTVAEPFYANGVAMAIPRNLFQQIGGFDTEMFAYGEDLDLSWRVRLLGYNILCTPGSVVYHYYSSSWGRFNPRRIRLVTRNHFRTLFKCLSPYNLPQALLGYGIFSLIKGMLLSINQRETSYFRSILLAFRDTIQSIESLRNDQKVTQALRTDLDSTIFRADSFGLFHSPREILRQFQVFEMLPQHGHSMANMNSVLEAGS